MTSPLAAALAGFEPESNQERADLAQLRALAATPDPWDRRLPLHVTASALVVDPAAGLVLLRWHDRLRRWLHVGGHGDPGETDPFAVACREAIEETGLDDVAAWPGPAPTLIQVAIVDVPANAREPAHHHADLRYLLATAHPERARAESPTTPLKWRDFDAAVALVGADDLAIAIGRARRLMPPA